MPVLESRQTGKKEKNQKDQNEKNSDNAANNNGKMEMPTVKELSKDEIIEILREEIRKKEKIIDDISNENKLLLDLTMKNAKRKLEELEGKILREEKKDS